MNNNDVARSICQQIKALVVKQGRSKAVKMAIFRHIFRLVWAEHSSRP